MFTKLFVNTQLFLQAYKSDQRGVTAIEYAILGVCMSAVVLTVFNDALRSALEGAIATISDNIDAASQPPVVG